ncbi:hypothetical protein T484DRAFT_1909591, partial [Baffinella frigidus]
MAAVELEGLLPGGPPPAPRSGGGRAWRRLVVGASAGVMLLAVVYFAASSRSGAAGRAALAEVIVPVIPEKDDPSEQAALIMGSVDHGGDPHREAEDFRDHDEPGPPNTGEEKYYAAEADSIIHHASGTLERIMHGPPPEPAVEDSMTISMPGGKAEAEAKEAETLVEAKLDTVVEPKVGPPAAVLTPPWKNAGATPDDNVFAHPNAGATPDDNVFAHPDDYVPVDSPRFKNTGRNYWHTSNGETTDGALGGLGEGVAPGSSAGTGPFISNSADSGAPASEGWTLNTQQDDCFHHGKAAPCGEAPAPEPPGGVAGGVAGMGEYVAALETGGAACGYGGGCGGAQGVRSAWSGGEGEGGQGGEER